MKMPDENIIAAYIDGKLEDKSLIKEIDDYFLKNPQFLKIVDDILRAKNFFNTEKQNFKDVPYELKERVLSQIDSLFQKKPFISLKLIKNGLKEIFNSFPLPCEAFTYNVRGNLIDAPVFHYTYSTSDIIINIYTFYEDDEHIKIKLEIYDNDNHQIDGDVSFISKGKIIEQKRTLDGVVEFDSVNRGEYEIIFEYIDILSVKMETKKKSLLITLD